MTIGAAGSQGPVPKGEVVWAEELLFFSLSKTSSAHPWQGVSVLGGIRRSTADLARRRSDRAAADSRKGFPRQMLTVI